MSGSFDTDPRAWPGRARARPPRRARPSAIIELLLALLVAVIASVGVASTSPSAADGSRVLILAEQTRPTVGPLVESFDLDGPPSDAPVVSITPTSTTTTTHPSTTPPPSTPPAAPPATATPAPTVAATSTTGSVAATADDRGHAALAAIAYPWQERLPGWSVSFREARDGLFGLTLVTEQRIEIYVRDGQSQELLAHVIAHEIGHAVDVTLNDGPDRRRWQDARNIGASPWWPGDGATDFSTGAGDFAESFAAWQVGTGSFRSELAGPPTDEQRALLAELSAG